MSLADPISIILFIIGIVAAFFIIFPLFWIFVVWLVSLFSGWRRLAKRYASHLPPQGKLLGLQTAVVGISRYRNTMTMGIDSSGIWMQPMWLFRAGHTPIFIPWGELHNPQPTMWRWERLVRYDVGMPKIGSVALPIPVLEKAGVDTSGNH